jgi:hypothetical protein
MKTNTPLSIKIILIVFFLFTLGDTYSQSNKTQNKTTFGQEIPTENPNPNTRINRCSTVEYEKYLQRKNPKRISETQFESWLAPLVKQYKAAKSNSKTAGIIITIPVVVHVIHSGQPIGTAPNITDAQVQSQITVLNEDFRRMFGTPGYNTNTVGADVEIEFVLAKQDPNGNPTNGIDRVNMCQSSWSLDEIETIVKPATSWNPSQYLNMWSLAFSDSNNLGYAQSPDASGLPGLDNIGGNANTDGVVSGYTYFGSITQNDGSFILDTTYNRGRTMTHEVGHWLGLRHIWGDATCGDDYCADTPIHHKENYGCPSPIPLSCDIPAVSEMIQNYMDYTDDACMNIFTQNQKDRILTVMNNSPRRSSLKTSTKGSPMALFANDAEIKIEAGKCAVDTQTAPCILPPSSNKQVLLHNRGTSPLTAVTLNYTLNGGANKTHNWTGTLAQDKSTTITLLNTETFGVLNVSVATANGGTDQRASNNSVSATFVAPASPTNYTFNEVTFTLQQDLWGSETTWSLKDGSGATIKSGGPYLDTDTLPALITENWTLVNNQCYIFTITDSEGDGICCGDSGDGYFNLKSTVGSISILSGTAFGYADKKTFTVNTLGTNKFESTNEIYVNPNPTKGTLTIQIPSIFGLPNSYAISNVLGQKMIQKVVSKETDLTINTSNLSNGIYFITVVKDDQKRTLRFIKE